jgi:hypothetical protein
MASAKFTAFLTPAVREQMKKETGGMTRAEFHA